jgi:PBP1b-binding outer membrane lipoprotein LpoB
MKRIAMVLAMGVALVGCSGQGGNASDTTTGVTQAAVPADVQTAVAVKRGIDASPDKADSVLQANGLTVAGFDSLMYRIAADSALRAAFASAR